MSKLIDGNNNVNQLEYDVLDNLVKVTDPNMNSALYTYDNLGNVISSTDRNGNTITYNYNSDGRLIDFTQNETSTTYDYAGENIIAITNPLGHKSKFDFNKKNKIISKKDPLGNVTTFEYDKNENLIKTSHPNGKTVTYTYNALNRLIEKDYGDDVDYYTYDEKENVTNASNSHITIIYKYNESNQILSKIYSTWNKTITYEYDANGNRTKMINPDNGVTTYSYDQNGRLTQMNNAFNEVTMIAYDAVSSIGYGNGITSNFSYNNINNTDAISIKKATNEIITDLSYTHDNIGNVTNFQKDGNTTTYAYDGAYRLKKVTSSNATSKDYVYDAADNRKALITNQDTSIYQHNEDNQLLSMDSIAFTYDDNGSLAEKLTSGQSTTYLFDGLNRLIKVVLPNGDFEAYTYDPFGNRIQAESSTKPTRRFIYDGSNILMELNNTNATNITYTTGTRIDSWISFHQNNASYFYHKDVLGSVIAISDINQNIVKTYTYDAFGMITAQTGTLDNVITYTGREYEADVELFFYRSRFYDPTTGRFISKDKFKGFLRRPQSQHKYNYAIGNPINLIDPLGTSCTHIGGISVLIVGATDKEAAAAGGLIGGTIGGAIGAVTAAGGSFGALSPVGFLIGFNAGRTVGGVIGRAVGALTSLAGYYEECMEEEEESEDEELPEPDDSGDSDGSDSDSDDSSPSPEESPGPTPDQNPPCDFEIPRLHAVDPNEITGPIGYDTAQWISMYDNLGFTIFYENDPEFATAPAQIVKINLPVAPKLNIYSVCLSDFGFGSFNFSVPENSTFTKNDWM